MVLPLSQDWKCKLMSCHERECENNLGSAEEMLTSSPTTKAAHESPQVCIDCGKPPEKEDLRIAGLDRLLQTYFLESTELKDKSKRRRKTPCRPILRTLPHITKGEQRYLLVPHTAHVRETSPCCG